MNNSTRRLIAGAGAGALLASLVACAPSAAPDDGESEIRMAGAIVVGYDPFQGSNLFNPTGQAVYDPLILVTMEGEDPQPWLAKSWEIADDGSSIEFTLRDDVDFADGTHFDAPGLEKYLDALFADDGYVWKPRVVDQFGAEATATGEYTLRIDFSKLPISYQWLWQFSLTPIASPAIVDDRSLVADGPDGSGPYVIDEDVPDVSVSFVRNPDYWNPDAFPYDRVTVIQFADKVAVLNALKSGQLDVGQIDPTLGAEAESSGLRVTEGPGTVGTLYIADHDGEIIPALGDVRVRQAIAMAFDRATIEATVGLGYGRASSQAFAPGQPEYIEGGDDRYPFDIDRAKELLAEAGYPDGFSITIPTYGGGGGDFGAVANTSNLEPIVLNSLAAIGITVTFEALGGDLGQYIESAWRGQYPIVMLNQPQTNWVVSFDYPFDDYDNPELTDLLRHAREDAPADQLVAYHKIGQFLLDQSWYVPFTRPSAIYASVPTVNVEMDGFYPAPKLVQFTPID